MDIELIARLSVEEGTPDDVIQARLDELAEEFLADYLARYPEEAAVKPEDVIPF